jgi:isopenicillin N synthase-like dioxygenase
MRAGDGLRVLDLALATPRPTTAAPPTATAAATAREEELLGTLRAALLEDSGCFYVVNHGVPTHLIDGVFDHIERFMAQPLEEKMEVHVRPLEESPIWLGSGYYTFGESEARQMRKKADTATRDLRSDSAKRRQTEFYMLKYAREAYRHNQYPSESFKSTCDAYVSCVLKMAREVISLSAAALGLPPSTFDHHFSNPTAQLRCNHYPADAPGEDSGLRIGAHTDSSFFTLLPQRSGQARGLEVQQPDGCWISPEGLDGSFLVNTGKILKLWTRGAANPTPHRVVRVSEDRVSLPLFLHPNWTSLIRPVSLPCSAPRDKAAALGAGSGVVEEDIDGATESASSGGIGFDLSSFPSLTVGEFMSHWHAGALREGDQLSKL